MSCLVLDKPESDKDLFGMVSKDQKCNIGSKEFEKKKQFSSSFPKWEIIPK